MRSKQTSFLPPSRLIHGGVVNKGKRKERSPFDSKRAMHITLRAVQVTREWSMLARRH